MLSIKNLSHRWLNSSSIKLTNRKSFLSKNDLEKLKAIKSKKQEVQHLGDMNKKEINKKAKENKVPVTRIGRIGAFIPSITRVASDILTSGTRENNKNPLSDDTSNHMEEFQKISRKIYISTNLFLFFDQIFSTFQQ